ncbi:hypothetical protein AB3S75_031246 [Citrus x aurantiifolia]
MLSWLDLLLFRMLSSKDINFVGYTYKKFEIVNEHHLPGIAEWKKKSTKLKKSTADFFPPVLSLVVVSVYLNVYDQQPTLH